MNELNEFLEGTRVFAVSGLKLGKNEKMKLIDQIKIVSPTKLLINWYCVGYL